MIAVLELINTSEQANAAVRKEMRGGQWATAAAR
jgi:hypothetical protein